MKYCITLEVLGDNPKIRLSKAQFDRIKKAKKCLLQVVNIEEKFNLIIENFREFEMELLGRSINEMLTPDFEWSSAISESSLINRRIANLMSACRLYLDHIIHHFNIMYSRGNKKGKELKTVTNEQFDGHLEYRIMEKLRNFVQHRGFPVQKLSYPSKLVDHANGQSISKTFTPILVLSYLEEEKKLRKIVRELKAAGRKELDLKPIVRRYIQCLSVVHAKFRELVKPDLPSWDTEIKTVVTRYMRRVRVKNENELHGLVIVAVNDDETWAEHAAIFTDITQHRQRMERKHRVPNNLTRMFVTGQVDGDIQTTRFPVSGELRRPT